MVLNFQKNCSVFGDFLKIQNSKIWYWSYTESRWKYCRVSKNIFFILQILFFGKLQCCKPKRRTIKKQRKYFILLTGLTGFFVQKKSESDSPKLIILEKFYMFFLALFLGEYFQKQYFDISKNLNILKIEKLKYFLIKNSLFYSMFLIKKDNKIIYINSPLYSVFFIFSCIIMDKKSRLKVNWIFSLANWRNTAFWFDNNKKKIILILLFILFFWKEIEAILQNNLELKRYRKVAYCLLCNIFSFGWQEVSLKEVLALHHDLFKGNEE